VVRLTCKKGGKEGIYGALPFPPTDIVHIGDLLQGFFCGNIGLRAPQNHLAVPLLLHPTSHLQYGMVAIATGIEGQDPRLLFQDHGSALGNQFLKAAEISETAEGQDLHPDPPLPQDGGKDHSTYRFLQYIGRRGRRNK
jgi:hypothetical protein